MKRYVSFLLAAVMVFALTIPARAAEIIIVNSETISVPVVLQTPVSGTAMAVTFAYDSAVLEILPEKCGWIPDGVLGDFDAVNRQAVWASDGEVKLSGEVCRLVFRVPDKHAFEETKITWEITVMNGPDTVVVHQQDTTLMKERTLTGIAVSAKPAKIIYVQNQDSLDVAGGKLTLFYSDGTTAELDMTEDMVTGFDNTAVGDQELTIAYGGFTTSLTVTVQGPQMPGGSCGENVFWKFDKETGVLTISGTGTMDHFYDQKQPWEQYNDRITKVVIEEGVTSLGAYALFENNAMQRLKLPASLSSICENSLPTIGALISIDVDLDNGQYCSDDGVLYTKDKQALMKYPTGKALQEYAVPDSVNVVALYAFAGCKGLGKLVFEGKAPYIDDTAFMDAVLTICYPADNPTWTSDVRQNYGGTITWKSVGESGVRMENIPVQEEETVYIPVSLQKTVTGMSMGLTYDYDKTVLEILPEECRWIPSGVMGDFSRTGCYAVWASEGETELSGEICILAFRIRDFRAFAKTEVSCTVTVKNGAETVGTYQDSARITKVCADIDHSGTVDEMDAVYLLWHTLFPREYPLAENLADFDGDGAVTDRDAVLLLWHALFPV